MIYGYREIVQALKIHQNIYNSANVEYEYYNAILYNRDPKEISGMVLSDMPKSNKNQMDISEVIAECQRWLHIMEIEQNHINEQTKKLEIIDNAIDEMKDIKVKVAQLRAIGLSQEQVAELVDRSTRQVQNIEKEISCNPSC